MQIESRKSAASLQDWIKEYYFFSNTEESIQHIPVIDDCCYDIIFFKEADSALLHGSDQLVAPINSNVFTIHSLNPPFKIQLGKSLNFFTIKVQPWMNSYFFSSLPHNGIVDLEKEKDKYGELYDKIFREESLNKKFELADDFMNTFHLIMNRNVLLVKEVCLFIYQKKGLVSVNQISENFGKTRQYIAKTFKANVLYSLKRFIITVRILDLIQHKRKDPEMSLTELCYQYEYFDQSHFIRDFKQVCGVTPSVFLAISPNSSYGIRFHFYNYRNRIDSFFAKKYLMRVTSIILVFSFLLISCSTKEKQVNQSQEFKNLQSVSDEYMTKLTELQQFNGVVLLKKGDEVVLRKSYNMQRDRNSKLFVYDDSQFDIRSIAKLYAKISIVELEEKGLLNRHDLLKKYLPDFPNADLITIEHLMHNKSGLPRELSNIENTLSLTADEVIQLAAKESLEFEPGTDQRYSNVGFQLLYYIIGKVNEGSFSTY